MTPIKYRVLKKIDYRGCPIYCRQFTSNLYEYAVVYKNEIYTAPFLTKRDLLKSLLLVYVKDNKMKSWKDYVEREKDAILQTLEKTAQITIDTLIKKENDK